MYCKFSLSSRLDIMHFTRGYLFYKHNLPLMLHNPKCKPPIHCLFNEERSSDCKYALQADLWQCMSLSCTRSHNTCILALKPTLPVSTSLFSETDFFEYGSWSIMIRISSHLTTASLHHIDTHIRHNSFIDDRVSNTPQQSNMQLN